MTSTEPVSTTIEAVDAYLAAYGEPDPERRAALIERSWAPHGVLVDPPLDPAAGHASLSELFATVQAAYPAHTFRRSTRIDQHHEFARYGWEMLAPDGSVVMTGTDVVDLAPDGRLARVIGFIGDLD